MPHRGQVGLTARSHPTDHFVVDFPGHSVSNGGHVHPAHRASHRSATQAPLEIVTRRVATWLRAAAKRTAGVIAITAFHHVDGDPR
jgi:hypothetical protein